MTIFTPLSDRVLLKRIEPESVSKGGIILPEISKGKRNEGVVVAVGSDAVGKLQVGQTVVVENWSGFELTLNGEDHIVLKIEECIGLVEEDKAN